jgi:hypothetical protein
LDEKLIGPVLRIRARREDQDHVLVLQVHVGRPAIVFGPGIRGDVAPDGHRVLVIHIALAAAVAACRGKRGSAHQHYQEREEKHPESELHLIFQSFRQKTCSIRDPPKR